MLLLTAFQDPCYNVRIGFLQRYTALAITLETRFYCIPFLTAQDPERETREYVRGQSDRFGNTDIPFLQARNFIALQYKRMPAEQRHLKFELLLVRYLHLLARHPDFTSHEPEILKDMCRFVSCGWSTEHHCSHKPQLRRILRRHHLQCGQPRAAIPPCAEVQDRPRRRLALSIRGRRYSKTLPLRLADHHRQNLYYLSEIAQEILKGRAKHHGWVLDNFPGKVKLPVDMFKPLPSADVAKEIAKTSYLTDEMTDWLEGHNRPVKSPVARTRVVSGTGTGARAPRKRKANGAADGSPPIK